MNDLRTQVRDIARRRRTVPSRLVDIAIAAALAVIVTTLVVHDPPRAPDVTIVNDTPYDLTINVSDATGQRWMGFAMVNAQSQFVVHAPIDQGDVWVFDYGTGGEYSVERSALREAGWRMHVPASVAQRLAAAGVVPIPQRT